jgi:hypothetical protein
MYASLLYDAGTVSWFWLFTGVVSSAVAAGPVASTSYGALVGAWFRRIGYGGRLIAMIMAAIVIGLFIGIVQPPMALSTSFTFGGLIGLTLVFVWEQLSSG